MKYYNAKKFTRIRDWLRVNMISMHLTQQEVANLVGLSRGYINGVANGYWTPGPLETVRKFAEAFNDDVDDVWDLC
jgi:transcriptional regulator with XRE-family HTH domain